jgi:hypothetical protein
MLWTCYEHAMNMLWIGYKYPKLGLCVWRLTINITITKN